MSDACRNFLLATQPSEMLAETLGKIEIETRRAGQVMERLRDLLSKDETPPVPLNLADLTHEVVSVLTEGAELSGVQLFVSLQWNTTIMADRPQIEQVLLNLVRNAIEAAATSSDAYKQGLVTLRRSGHDVQVDVEDNGPGVKPEIAEDMFEPFVTGKPKGMGLGLFLSRQIVEYYGGTLWCDDSVAKGARFCFRLPSRGRNADDA